MIRRITMLVLLAGLLAACSGATNGTSSTSGWVRSDLKPVSQPLVVDGVAVVYTAVSGGLNLIGLNGASGSTLWHIPASPSGNTPGVGPELLANSNGDVIYFKPTSGQSARLAAVDPHSGNIVWSTGDGTFFSWPEACPGDAAAVCTTGQLGSDQQTRLLRFSGSNGHQLVSPVISAAGNGGRELAPGLFDPGNRNPEDLLAASDPTASWTVPLASDVSLAGASTDNGWNIDRIARVGLFVGSIAGAPTSQTSTSAVFDLSNAETFGIRINDGSVVWQNNGSYYACSLFPCPGGTNSSSTSGAGAGSSQGPTVGVRTREAGTISASQGGSPVVSSGATVVVEGFDPATGTTVWSFNAGTDAALIAQSSLAPQLGPSTVALPNASGVLTSVDLATGVTAQIAPTTVLWCQTVTSYTESTPYQAGNSSINQYTGGFSLFPCDTSRHEVANPAKVPSFVGSSTNGFQVWSESNRVVARPTAP